MPVELADHTHGGETAEKDLQQHAPATGVEIRLGWHLGQQPGDQDDRDEQGSRHGY